MAKDNRNTANVVQLGVNADDVFIVNPKATRADLLEALDDRLGYIEAACTAGVFAADGGHLDVQDGAYFSMIQDIATQGRQLCEAVMKEGRDNG
jgi:hypothetical protein